MLTSPTATRLCNLTALACLGLMPPAQAQAQAQEASSGQTYFYGGVGVGQSRSHLNESRLIDRQLGSSATATNIERHERDTAYKVLLGYQFMPWLGVEGGYFVLGKPYFTAQTTAPGELKGEVRMRGLNLDLVGTVPLVGQLSALGRIGGQYAKSSGRFSGTGAVVPADPSPREHQFNYKFGAGLQYDFSPAVLLRAEWEQYRVSSTIGGHDRVNVLGLSLIFPFGRSPTAVPVAAAPLYTEPPAAAAPYVPPPTPAVAVVTAPPRQRVSFSAESLFSFDQTHIGADGRAALDQFVTELQNTDYTVIEVEGYTDRLGSTEYNQRLSEQRAETVKAYLVASGRVDPGKVSASGKGEDSPVTPADQCTSRRETKALIACLHADRRVEIEVVGTR
jgi:OOP family OmpA-OmpF porin